MGARRTAYEFVVDIINACREPMSITDLFYQIKTQYVVINRWLNEAMRFKLIEPIGNNKYHTTQKGRNFLTRWQEIQAFLKEES